MRNLERSGQWFTALLIAIFALPIVAILLSVVSDRSFWSNLLPSAGTIILIILLRSPLQRLGRALRFIAWLGIGAVAAALYAWTRGEAFSLTIAALFGLVWAIADLGSTFWSARQAADG